MWAIQREEGCVADAEGGRTCGYRDRKDVVLIIVLIEDVVLDCLDRERVDVVVDDRAPTRIQTGNRNGHDHPKTTIKHCIGCSNGKGTGNHNHKMGHDLGALARDKTMLDARDRINTAAAAVGISTPRNT